MRARLYALSPSRCSNCAAPTRTSRTTSGPVRLPPASLDGDRLRGQHLVVERVHAGRGLVDLAGEGDRALQDRPEALLVLDAGRRVLVLHDEIRVGHVEL